MDPVPSGRCTEGVYCTGRAMREWAWVSQAGCEGSESRGYREGAGSPSWADAQLGVENRRKRDQLTSWGTAV